MTTEHFKVSSNRGVGPSSSHSSAKVGPKGTWRAQTLQPVQPAEARGFFQPEEKADEVNRDRPLFDRSASSEQPYRRVAGADVLQRARGMASMGVVTPQVQMGAKAILQRLMQGGRAGAVAVRAGRRASSATRDMSARLAASCLEDDVSDEELTELLSNTGSDERAKDDSREELLALLHRALADEDGDALEELLDTVLDGVDISAKDRDTLVANLWDKRRDDTALLKLLREAQGIPSLQGLSAQERQTLREQAQDQVANFACTPEGAVLRTGFNAAPVAANTADPNTFLDTYVKLVTVEPRTFAGAGKLLLSIYPTPEQLEKAVDDMKQALADDMSAATTPWDKSRLGNVVTHMGNMFVLTTMHENVKLLTEQVDKLRGIQHAPAR